MPAQVQTILSGLFGGSSQEGSLVHKLERMRDSARGLFGGRAARKKQSEFAATVRRNADDAAAQSRMRWTRVLGLLRLSLAILCFGFSVLALDVALWSITVLWGLFVLYSIVAAIWSPLEKSGHMLLSLLLDTIFFFMWAVYPFEPATWLTSIFYLFVLLSAALLHTAREVFIVVGITLVLVIFSQPTQSVALSPALLLTGTAVCVLALQRRAMEVSLAIASRQQAQLRAEALKAAELERQRIAADFHDGPLQSFVAIQMRLEVVKKLIERDPKVSLTELGQVQDMAATQAIALRAFVRSMRPVEVDGNGLIPSLQQLTDNFERESGIQASFLGAEAEYSPEPEIALEVIQAVREALHNAQKHSRAKSVKVSVSRDVDFFHVSIQDDGAGFPFSGTYSLDELELLRLGPLSIRQRVRNVHGGLVLESYPGKGSHLKIRVPV